MLKMLLHKVSFTCNFKFVYVSQDEGQKHSTKKKKASDSIKDATQQTQITH